MKSRMLTCITAITLFAALAIPLQLTALKRRFKLFWQAWFVFSAIFLLANISQAGFPPYKCTYSNRDVTLNTCTMTHTELVGTDTRYYDLMIPNNYVPGQSGLVVNVGNTGHGIHGSPTGGWCNTTKAGNEVGGWGPYLRSVPKPAPVLLCAEGGWDSNARGSDPIKERWNWWGTSEVGWDNGVIPDDADFVRQAILITVHDLSLDPKTVFITDDWATGANVIDQIAILNSDIITAVGTYAAATFWTVNENMDITYGIYKGTHISPPKDPISAIRLSLSLQQFTQMESSMCGTNLTGALYAPLNDDDVFDYYAKADGISNFKYGDPRGSNTQFCTGKYNSVGVGTSTSLEMKQGTGGRNGTEVVEYKMVGAGRGPPYCSFDWFGNDTYCTPGIGPAIDLRNSKCNWQEPCNHYVNSSTGYDIKGLVYKFFLAHPKP